MLIRDYFYRFEKWFHEGPSWVLGWTIWFTELLTFSLGGNVKCHTLSLKSRILELPW